MWNAHDITGLHSLANIRWHEDRQWPDAATLAKLTHGEPLLAVVLTQHRANFDLWHEEDKAREPDAPDHRIAQVKHAIDALNQTRNDQVETMDRTLLEAVGRQDSTAPLHSESPGLIIDRLSILALKVYHTTEEVHRTSASEAHHSKNRDRLALLEEQRSDLAACLDQLWSDVLNGSRRFKLYRQMKMYNDPDLNPMVYAHKVPELSS